MNEKGYTIASNSADLAVRTPLNSKNHRYAHLPIATKEKKMKQQTFFGTALLAAGLFFAPTVVQAVSVSGIDFQYDSSGATVTNTTNTVVTMTATSDCVAHTSVAVPGQ